MRWVGGGSSPPCRPARPPDGGERGGGGGVQVRLRSSREAGAGSSEGPCPCPVSQASPRHPAGRQPAVPWALLFCPIWLDGLPVHRRGPCKAGGTGGRGALPPGRVSPGTSCKPKKLAAGEDAGHRPQPGHWPGDAQGSGPGWGAGKGQSPWRPGRCRGGHSSPSSRVRPAPGGERTGGRKVGTRRRNPARAASETLAPGPPPEGRAQGGGRCCQGRLCRAGAEWPVAQSGRGTEEASLCSQSSTGHLEYLPRFPCCKGVSPRARSPGSEENTGTGTHRGYEAGPAFRIPAQVAWICGAATL